MADGGELVSFESPAPRDLRVLVPEKGLHLCERLGHDVPHFRVGEDRPRPPHVVIDPAEYLRCPGIARGARHELAEIVEESLLAGAQSLRRAEDSVKFIVILHSCARKDACVLPVVGGSLCRVLSPRLRASLTYFCVCVYVRVRACVRAYE